MPRECRRVRVGIDGRVLSAGKPRRGVAVYLESLLRELARAFPEDDYTVLVPGRPRDAAVPAGVHVVSRRAPGRALFGAAAVVGRPRLDAMLRSPNVVWVPAVAPIAVSRDVPLVFTVHDLSFEHRPRDFTAYERLWHRLARPRAL